MKKKQNDVWFLNKDCKPWRIKKKQTKMSNSRNCVGCDEEDGIIKIKSSFLTLKMFSEVTGILKGSQTKLASFNILTLFLF